MGDAGATTLVNRVIKNRNRHIVSLSLSGARILFEHPPPQIRIYALALRVIYESGVRRVALVPRGVTLRRARTCRNVDATRSPDRHVNFPARP